MSLDGSPLMNATVVVAEGAVKLTLNVFQTCDVLPAPFELTAVNIGFPSTNTLTVLLVPNIPPGFTTLPTAKLSEQSVPAVVATVWATPVALSETPVRSSH